MRQRDADRTKAFEERSKDPAQREARQRSRTAYAERSDNEALEVAKDKRRDVIEAQPWKAPHFRDDERIRSWMGDSAAVIASSSEVKGGGLLQSTLPLRAVDRQGKKRMLDFSLVDRGGALEPDNPLVDLRLPKRLADGITVGQITVRPDAADVNSSLLQEVEGKGFWANVRIATGSAAARLTTTGR